MATSPALYQVTASAGLPTRINELIRALGAAGIYGINAETTAGLTLGIYGGRYNSVDVANGTVALTASNTNYVVAHRTTGAVSVSTGTTNWNNNATYARLHQIATNGTGITDITDARLDTGGLLNGGGGGLSLTSHSADYTFVLDDANTGHLHPSADTTGRTWTIPANGSVAYPVGTAITIVNQNAAGVITIAITTDTMRLAGAGTTGSRSLAANGIATALKITATEWLISGTGLT